MRLLLIVLLCLFTPLYFTALQASNFESLTSKQKLDRLALEQKKNQFESLTPQQKVSSFATLTLEQKNSIFESLTPEQKVGNFASLTLEQKNSIFESLTPEQKLGNFKSLIPEQKASIFESLTPEEKAVNYNLFSPVERTQVDFKLLSPEIKAALYKDAGLYIEKQIKQEEMNNETNSYAAIAVESLKKLVSFTNAAIQGIAEFGKVSADFLDHPVSQITETGARVLRDLFSGYYSHANQLSQVYPASEPADITTDVGSGMHAFHTKRTQHVKKALQKTFEIVANDSHVPKIALAISGGGMRACIVTAGFLAGAEQTGLLDCVMYNAAISGGSWAVGSASYLFAKSNPRVTFTEFKNTLVQHLDKGTPVLGSNNYLPPMLEHPASDGMARNLFRRVAWNEPVTSMELYGALIANVTLQGVDGWNQSNDGKRFDVKFSDVAIAVHQGILPLPMLATVVPINPLEKNNPHGYKWMAFTPLRAGTKNIGGYLPMWAMGRAYIEGQNDLTYKGFAAEYSLSYLLGVAGSAYEVNLKYFLNQKSISLVNENPVLEVQGFKIPIPIKIADIADSRLYPYKIHNFTKDIQGAPLSGETHEFMPMIDGAFCFNIPLPLVTKPEDTASDIIIMVDADSDAVNNREISETLATINRHFTEINPGVMPELNPRIVIKMYREGKVFHIFNDPRHETYDDKLPVVLYFPLIRNEQYSQTFDPAGFTSKLHPEVDQIYVGPNYLDTFNFKYTQQQAQELADLMEYNVKQSIPEIKKMLKAYMQHRQKNEKQLLDQKYKEKKPGFSFDFDMN